MPRRGRINEGEFVFVTAHEIDELVKRWRSLASVVRDELDERGAAIVERRTRELEELFMAKGNESVSAADASEATGYSQDHLRRQLGSGAGERGRPRMRRGDLPPKGFRRLARSRSQSYDPIADVRALKKMARSIGMSPRRTRVAQRRRTEHGTRTLSLGPGGHRVRLFEDRQKGGMIYREVQLPGGSKSRRSLETRDWKRAEQLGLQIVSALIAGREAPTPAGPVKLGELCKRFLSEAPMLLDKADQTRREAATRLNIVQAVIGGARDVRTLSKTTFDSTKPPPRGRDQVRQEIGDWPSATTRGTGRHQAAQVHWAGSVTDASGNRLLERNPLEYVQVKGEQDVARPIASFERFEATKEAMHKLQAR
jgi:hypothetical protein